jgi:hypothetical protein
VGRLDFLETILQAFTIDSGGQRAAISSAEISWGRRGRTPRRWVFWGRRGSGRFPIYGGDGDRWAVRGDLKGLYEVGSERGFGDDQRGFVIVHPQLNGFQAESDDQKVIKCLLGGEVGGNISHRVLEVWGRLVCGRR